MKADRFVKVALASLFFTMTSVGQAPTNRNVFNDVEGPFPTYNKDFGEHYSTGQHDWTNVLTGTCTYSGTGSTYGPTPCGVHSAVTSTTAVEDTGYVTGTHWHTTGMADKSGSSDGPAWGDAYSDGEGTAAVSSCSPVPCGMGINITGGGAGTGLSANYSPVPYWSKTAYYKNVSCTGLILPQSTSCEPSGPPPYSVTPPQYWYWNTSSCQYQVINGQSPVVIDTKSVSFKFTDPTQGNYVTFDLHGDGTYLKLSWTKDGSGNMWLVLPDANGQVTNGKELFGNYTPHSDGGVKNHPNPNGFLALAWYDKPDNGGDGNLILDPKDSIWANLRLWDATRCLKQPDTLCVSEPDELYTLESRGIRSISLIWAVVRNVMPSKTAMAKTKSGDPVYGALGGPTDLVGNQYKFYAVLNPDAEDTPLDDKGHFCCELHKKSHDGRWAVDVFLTSVK